VYDVNFLGPPRAARKLSRRLASAALCLTVQAGGITCLRLLVALCWATPLRDIVGSSQCLSMIPLETFLLDQKFGIGAGIICKVPTCICYHMLDGFRWSVQSLPALMSLFAPLCLEQRCWACRATTQAAAHLVPLSPDV
jgi:hypothetical protein